MNRIISISLLVCGVVLVVYGLSSADSIGSSFSRFFTGTPTDESIWMTIGGIAAVAVGSTGLILGWSRQT